MNDINNIVEEVLTGNKRAIARAISLVENDYSDYYLLLNSLYHKTGNAFRIGITGPPGCGKSTLAKNIAKYFKTTKNYKIAIIAIDPTSPFTGGAILGDRIRMDDIELDENIFIRSMANRNQLGGLSKKTNQVADILDAAGFDIIIIETVGVGQSEIDIFNVADSTIVVLTPESGDGIQAMKAGLMEVADIFVMNKSDRQGAYQAIFAIEMFLNIHHNNKNGWITKILKTQANENFGIDNVVNLLNEHFEYLKTSNLIYKKRSSRYKKLVQEIIQEQWQNNFWTNNKHEYLQNNLDKIFNKKITPYELATEIITQK